MNSRKLYKLTKPQQTIWISEQFTDRPINNIVGSMNFNDKIDINKLKEAINLTVKNNDALRTILCEKDGSIVQYFDDFVTFDIPVVDLTTCGLESIDKLRNEFYGSKFQLLNHKLFDFIILQLPNHQICLIGKFHHIIADAWSLGLIIDHIAINYSNLALESNISLPLNSYSHFISREEKYLSSDTYSKNLDFWTQKLNSYNPISLKSYSKNSYIASRNVYTLSDLETSNINKFCHNNGISPYVLFMCALNIYLYRATMQNDITITSPILNRIGKEKQTMGMFINMICMRIVNNPSTSVVELLKEISAENITLFKNSKCPFMDVLANLRKNNPNMSNKSYNIVFSYQNMRPNKKLEALVDYDVEWNFTGYSQDELVINVTDINDSGNFSISYDYLVDLFSETEIKYLHSRLSTIINNIIANPDLKISEINIMSNNEKNKLLYDFNSNKYEYDTSLTIPALFEKVVKNTPDSIAVKYKDQTLTYKELNNYANSIAKEIIEKNIKNSKIAIICDKSIPMVAGLLGILKSGNCYIPIDPIYPKKRIEYILNDSNVQFVLTTKKYSQNYIDKNLILLDNIVSDNFSDNINNATPDLLAYMIYTSGTTGNPKGVLIKHKNIVNTLIWRKNTYNLGQTDSVLQIPSFAFDSSVEDIFTPLISGARLVIPDMEKMDVNIISKEIVENNVTHFLVVPSLYKILLSEKSECLKSLKIMTIAGEGFSMSLINEHFAKLPNVRIINEYGPTENSVCSTFYEITNKDTKILIGKPINNCKCYCLDSNQKLLPIGIEGELYVSGPGVSCGYLNKPDKTSERFLDNPFGGEFKLYKTGDMVKYDFDGNLEFIERLDNQVKLHGFRIELKEIENAILETKLTEDAVVVIQKLNNGKSILVAYITGKNIDTDILYDIIREKLPYYMIPKIVLLDKLPLNPNGKIDKSKLPIPEAHSSKHILPETELEKTLLAVCKEVLENNEIGVLDDLFKDCDADSLSILNISSKLFNMNIQIGIQDFYKYPTIRELAKHVEAEKSGTAIVPSEKEDIIKPYATSLPDFDTNNVSFQFSNVLLTGVTGFLGVHVLNNLLQNTSCNVYCLIREKYGQSPENRLKALLLYYFDNDYYDKYKNRIFVQNSDLAAEHLGMDNNSYNSLQNTVDCIINCAANTKHYGNYDSFESENIKTVQNLIDFAQGKNIVLNHISTTTISGNFLVNSSMVYDFTENDFYIGQNYKNNVYVNSKFEAEKLIITAEHNGLKANIFRLSNLMGRSSDGMFQKNKYDNAYYTRLMAFAKIGYLPEELKNEKLEFSPIDNVADSIVKLLGIPNLQSKIFHIVSNKLIDINVVLNTLHNMGIPCGFTSQENFLNELNKPQNEKFVKYLITDINTNDHINLSSKISVNSDISNKYLEKLNFKWDTIDENYLTKFFKSTKLLSDLK